MKHLLKYFGILILAAATIYLLGAFWSWELNPGRWEEGGRYLYVVVLFFFGGLLLAFLKIEDDV